MNVLSSRALLLKATLCGALLLGGMTVEAFGLAEETIGNRPLHEINYRDWQGIMPLVNDPHRVYRIWVNGNEHFYYRGDTAALNRALREFAALKVGARELILRPGPAGTKTFKGVPVPYDWQLHIRGGISRGMALKEAGTNVFEKYPTMTVFVGEGKIDLGRIRVPKGVTVLDLGDLRRRYLEGLKSKDHHVRGYAAYFLGRVDAFHEDSAAAVSKLLDDEDDWVRLMAAGALGNFGKAASAALPKLRSGLGDDSQRIRDRFQETIQRIEDAEDTTAAAQKHRAAVKRIKDFREKGPADLL